MPNYSAIVRTLRVAVPMAGIFLLVLFFLWPAITRIRMPTVDKAIISGDRTELVNPRYEGQDEKGNRYRITAERAVQFRSVPNTVQLQNPSAVMLDVGASAEGASSTPNVRAGAGTYDHQSKQLQMNSGVTLTTAQGDQFQTPDASVDLNTKMVRADHAISGSGPTLSLSGNGLLYDQAGGLLTIAGPAKLVLYQTGGQDGKSVPDQPAEQTPPPAP